MPENRLAIEVSEATGLRIDDVLSLKTDMITRTSRPTVVDSKTGKKHRIYIPVELRERMLKQAGKVWVWPGRLNPKEAHRTRQAVYKDMVQAAAIFRRNGTLDGIDGAVSPHTARKRAAVAAYEVGGLNAAQNILNHSRADVGVTLLYALANKQQSPPKRKRGRG